MKKCGCDYWTDIYDSLFVFIFILSDKQTEELLLRLNTPDALKEEGASAVARHILAVSSQGKKETKEARIILLGAKGAGKTSLARKLRYLHAILPGKEKSTSGVITTKLKLFKDDVTYLWDFGGEQAIRYSRLSAHLQLGSTSMRQALG
jgi:GTPase SAR1 family protein